MGRISLTIVALAILITAAWVATCGIFDSPFAEVTIDWLAFLAGIFLVVEGIYKMLRSKVLFSTDQLLRAFRVVIGTCVFTIHLLQFMRY
ncbi:MAG: hypothetical protein ABIH74_02390 [Candidatus Omnitrophota bacterium]